MTLLMSKCPGHEANDIKKALGFMVARSHVKGPPNGGFIRIIRAGDYDKSCEQNEWSPRIKALMPLVEKHIAMRQGQAVPSTPPVDRFYLFLRAQGWKAFADWWQMTSNELMGQHVEYPTSTTVLCSALVEAALAAIANPAIEANQWRERWLRDSDPPDWKFGKLVRQAESAKTLSASEATMANGLAELRNRIHAGKFATKGTVPVPPSIDAHQARIAKDHMNQLLSTILEWTYTNCPSVKKPNA